MQWRFKRTSSELPCLCFDADSFFLAFLLSKLRDTVLTSHSGPTWWKMLFHLSSSPFEKKQCELSLVLLPSFFKLASVYVFSGERFNHLVWDRVHISGSHAGSLGRGGDGPNQMPRHELMNLDTFLKTLSYLLSLKKVKLLLKKKKKCILLASLCTLEDLVRHVAHLPDGSKRPEELHPGCSLPGASSLLWPVVLGLLHPPDLSSR